MARTMELLGGHVVRRHGATQVNALPVQGHDPVLRVDQIELAGRIHERLPPHLGNCVLWNRQSLSEVAGLFWVQKIVHAGTEKTKIQHDTTKSGVAHET